MSYFDDASLVMIPSGYKTSKVYSVKPTDGTGDLTFTRSNDTATRVASNGLIEKVRTNVLTYSQDFSNANWVGFDVSRTGSQTDPNGGTTSSLYTSLTNSANVSANFSTTSSSPYALSIYIKGTTSGSVSLRVDSGGTAAQNNISYTTAWQRFTYTFTAGASTSTVVLGGYASFTTGEGIYVAFGQAETGDIATDYIATTSAAVSVGPVANVPRLDYLGSTCPRLLLEPQRSNLATYSEQFNNAAWSTQEINVTANAAIAPDGTQSADNIVPTAITGTHQIFSGALVSSSQCAMSVYAKANGYTTFQMLDRASGSNGGVFNLANGTATNAGSGIATITSVGNGWYRCTAVATTTGVRFYVPTSASNFTGDGTSGVLLWGAQVEAGAYATSYIPTLGAAVTRGADACSKDSIGALFGSAYTLFGEITNQNVNNARHIAVKIPSGSQYDNFITIYQNGSGLTATGNNAAATAQFSITSGAFALGANLKFALRCELNNVAFYINGVQIGTDNTATIPAVTTLHVGGYTDIREISVIKQAIVFPTALTNAQLAELTA